MFDCYNSKSCTECCCHVKPGLFRNLKDEDRALLYKDRLEVEFKVGETIFKEGAALTHLACIKEGFVKMSTESNHSRNFLIRLCQPGEVVGGMGLYVDEVNQATCSALTNVKCCLINLNSFKATLQKNNGFAIELIKKLNILAISSKKQAVDLTSKSMYSRVADMLMYLSQEIYKSESFNTSLKRQDLADYCAITKESTIRILKEFKESGIISVKGNSFEIHKYQELKRISDYY